MKRFLSSSVFWATFLTAGILSSLFFAWETDLLAAYVKGPLRPPVNTEEWIFSVGIILLFSLNVGLFFWGRKYGSCPRGVRRATGRGTVLGAVTLLCPACTVLPLTFIGAGVTLAFLGPFLPLLRIVAVIILLAVSALLWPKK